MKRDDFYKKVLDNLSDGVYFVDPDRVITYWNKGAERITGYSAGEVIGRSCSDNILVHTDRDGKNLCKGLCPLACAITENNDRDEEIYLLHKDGHRVRVRVRVSSMLDEGGKVLGGVEIFTEDTRASSALDRPAELERLAFIDSLTGLANRRYAEITLRARVEELQRYGWPFGVIFIDIDHFKAVNDAHGHDVGDEVLKTVARTLQNSVRSFDVVGRWGGEEYLAIIANIGDRELAMTAERCRALVAQSSNPSISPLHVTVSLGATLAQQEDTAAMLVKRADLLMYESKRAGRNRVTIG